jgi:hypothetical protein
MQAAQVSQNLFPAPITTGTSPGVDCRGITPIGIYLIGIGALSQGAIQLETAHDKDYTGAWAALGTPITFVANATVLAPAFSQAVAAIRARVTANIVGGTGQVYIVGGSM